VKVSLNRGQHSRAGAFGPKFMAPADFAGLIVDGLKHTFAPNAVIRTRPPVDAISWFGKVDRVAGMGVDNEQSVLVSKLGNDSW